MAVRDLTCLVLLGMLWGASFLFVRIAAPELGAVPLIEVRVVLAAAVLLPFVIVRRQWAEIRRHWRAIAWMGLIHYALPFTLFAYSMLTLSAGYSAIINASSPLFATVVAWAWLGERPRMARVMGLVIGVLGVLILVSNRLVGGESAAGPAIAAAVLASFFYGAAAVLAKKRLAGVSPMAVSAGSMLAAATILLPASWWLWPAHTPSAGALTMSLVLGVACTAVAFVLYFRLIANVGPTRAISVTFLIPVFAVVFGALFIDEVVTLTMVAGGAVILLGIAMALGLLDFSRLLAAPRRLARFPSLAQRAAVGSGDS